MMVTIRIKLKDLFFHLPRLLCSLHISNFAPLGLYNPKHQNTSRIV